MPELKIIKSSIESKIKIRLGEEEPISTGNLKWIPDGHLSMHQNLNRDKKIWVSAGPEAYLFQTRSLANLGTPRLVLAPEKTTDAKGYQGYAALHSVIPGAKPRELIGFYHQEHWPSKNKSFPFLASIGVATSIDGGLSWQKQGTIIRGKNPADYAGQRPACSGAGQPSAIAKKDQVYLFHIDWNQQETDAIHLAKAPLSNVANPNAWQKYQGSNFGSPGNEKPSKAVIIPPTDQPNTSYTALPGISYNHYLHCYLVIFETNLGFYLGISNDVFTWYDLQLLVQFPQPHSERKPGQTWFSYPTIISPDTTSDRDTTQNGYLYYSRGIWEKSPHQMVRRSFNLYD